MKKILIALSVVLLTTGIGYGQTLTHQLSGPNVVRYSSNTYFVDGGQDYILTFLASKPIKSSGCTWFDAEERTDNSGSETGVSRLIFRAPVNHHPEGTFAMHIVLNFWVEYTDGSSDGGIIFIDVRPSVTNPGGGNGGGVSDGSGQV